MVDRVVIILSCDCCIYITWSVMIYVSMVYFCPTPRLIVVGRRTRPIPMELDKDETSPLYEEVFVEDGVLEEYFAFDKT